MFAKRLIELRNKEKLTQKELAAKLNLGRGALSLYEIGQREPDLQTVVNMADYFKVSTDYLLGRTNTPDYQVESGNEIDPEYRALINTWENKKRTSAELNEILQIEDGYMELILGWQRKGISPEKVKELWKKMVEMSTLLGSPKIQ